MTTMETCKCREYRAARNGVGDCVCTHGQHYHKRGVGPCWSPTKMGAGR